MVDSCIVFAFIALAGVLVFFAYEAHVFIPSITRAYNYVPASMTVHQIDLASAYSCNLVCFCDEVDDAKAETCYAMQNRAQALSPLQCTNTSSCPPTGAAAVCSNGPYCCTSCNDTCSSHSQNVCKCPCQACSTCSCCKHIEGRLCRLFCDPSYKVNMMLYFKDRHGMPRSANVSHDAGSDYKSGQDFYNAHPANSSFLGFYKPSDLSIVHVSRGYHVGKTGGSRSFMENWDVGQLGAVDWHHLALHHLASHFGAGLSNTPGENRTQNPHSAHGLHWLVASGHTFLSQLRRPGVVKHHHGTWLSWLPSFHRSTCSSAYI